MPGIGLAPITGTDMLPEAAAASGINAAANAVARPRGIGLAVQPMNTNLSPDIALPQQAAPLEAPAIAPDAAPGAKPQAESYYDFDERPVQSIGRAMEAFAAGYRGDPSPVAAFNRDQLERQAMQYKTAAFALDAMDKIVPFVLRAPSGQRGDIIKDLDARFSGALGGHSIAPFLSALTAGTDAQAQSAMAAIKDLNPSPSMLSYFSDNPVAAVKFLSDYAAHKADQESPEDAKLKAKAAAEGAKEGGKSPDELAADTAAVEAAKKKASPDKTPKQLAEEAYATTFAKTKAERDAGGGPGPENAQKLETQLRGEFTTQAKPFVIIRDAYNNIKDASNNPSAASDISLLFAYMKLLDPNSVVRESEFATAANAGGIPDRVRAQYNAAMNGQRLDDNIRKDIVGASDRIYKTQETSHKALRTEYGRLAKDNGLKDSNVIVDYLGGASDKIPKGVDPALWEHMTPEERALWK